METPIIGAIIIASAALIVCAVTIAFKYWHAQGERRINAGKDLIASFDHTKEAIKDYKGYFSRLMNILRDHFKGQKIAAHEFRRHLGPIKRYRFNKAWNQYHGNDEEYPNFIQYEKVDVHVVPLSRIEEILKFTK